MIFGIQMGPIRDPHLSRNLGACFVPVILIHFRTVSYRDGRLVNSSVVLEKPLLRRGLDP